MLKELRQLYNSHIAKPAKSQNKREQTCWQITGGVILTDVGTARLPVDMPILVSICKVNKHTH